VSGADKPEGKDVARVSVRILDKEYLIACPFEERSALLDAAQHLDSRVRALRERVDGALVRGQQLDL
jgi:cell division protein ZapA (FtsZ GTPase activity inhibitor)